MDLDADKGEDGLWTQLQAEYEKIGKESGRCERAPKFPA
jgi:hypothetical protein